MTIYFQPSMCVPSESGWEATANVQNENMHFKTYWKAMHSLCIHSTSSYLLSAHFVPVVILGMEEGTVVLVMCNCQSSNKRMCMPSHVNCVWLCATLWTTVACQAPLSVGFSRQENWISVPCSRGSSLPRNRTCVSYVYMYWQAGSLPLVPPGKPSSNKGKQ